MADPRNTEPLPLPPLALLIAGAALTVASHTLWLPYWVDAAAAALLIWRAMASIRGAALPARWLLILLTLAGAVGVFFSYRTIMGRDPGVTMLVLLLFLKLLETRARRDVFVVAFLVYFVALANFFYSQSIPIAGLMLLTVLVTTTALVGFSAPQRRAEADERGRGDEHGKQHQPGDRDGLGVEKVGQGDEVDEKSHDEDVAPGARLQQLEKQEQHEHRHSRVPAHDRAVGKEDADRAGQSQEDQQPARGQGGAANRRHRTPDEKRRRGGVDPVRQPQCVRRHSERGAGDEQRERR